MQTLNSTPLECIEEYGRTNLTLVASVSAVSRGGTRLRWPSIGMTMGSVEMEPHLEPRYLIASLTKPVTATAAMHLLELADVPIKTRVSSILPEFRGDGKDGIEIFHLLTHTSGLPDMVEDNVSLRDAQAGLDEFYASVCNSSVCFEPGSDIGYQSMGFLVLSKLVERLSGRDFSRLLSEVVLEPTGMNSSVLRAPGTGADYDVLVELPTGQLDKAWHWNSSYWRRLGAPWGGLQSTASDMAAFAYLFVSGGFSVSGKRVLSERTVSEMCKDWTSSIHEGLPPFGLSWFRRGAPETATRKPPVIRPDGTRTSTPASIVYDREFLGLSTSVEAVGHCGVTGCVMWADPDRGFSAAVLTNSPNILETSVFADSVNAIALAAQVEEP